MNTGLREHDRAVLEALSEDYLSFESVVSKISMSNHTAIGAREIGCILLSSMANRLVAAYLIYADPPYATEVGANPDTIQRYWFSITNEGLSYLRGLIDTPPVQRRRRTR